jgi:hypothetical protein
MTPLPLRLMKQQPSLQPFLCCRCEQRPKFDIHWQKYETDNFIMTGVALCYSNRNLLPSSSPFFPFDFNQALSTPIIMASTAFSSILVIFISLTTPRSRHATYYCTVPRCRRPKRSLIRLRMENVRVIFLESRFLVHQSGGTKKDRYGHSYSVSGNLRQRESGIV